MSDLSGPECECVCSPIMEVDDIHSVYDVSSVTDDSDFESENVLRYVPSSGQLFAFFYGLKFLRGTCQKVSAG
jgi:hypothetical protein